MKKYLKELNSESKSSQLKKLLGKIAQKKYVVGIVGLGYVGLPLMWTFHKKGMPIIGFDIDQNKVDCIRDGTPYLKHLGEEMMEVLSNSNRCSATADFSYLSKADAILMCVPTPLDAHREPDMQYVEKTSMVIGENLQKGQMVVLESTTYPGTTEDLIIPILESKSGFTAGKEFYVAYSPEREDPGNSDFNTSKIPKVVGGHSSEALVLACALYDTAIVQTVPVSDTKTAEAVKITENVFRAVNIALVNELKVVFNNMGIDIHEVLDAADTKPFGFMKFVPGPGLGGHCIPIDPFYLTWKAREHGQHTRFIELAGEINTQMPRYVVDQTLKALNSKKKPLNGSKVLVIGLAYKPDVDDIRESPTFKILDLLKEYKAEISYYDPHVPIIKPTREYDKWTGMTSVEWKKEVISSFDAIIISTDHSSISYGQLNKWSDCIIDTRNAMNGYGKKDGNVWQA